MSQVKEYPRDSVRIFKSPFLEFFTHVHPSVPIIMWGPFISYVLYTQRELFFTKQHLTMAVMGLLVWTLAEYILHRVFFHYEPTSAVGKYIIMLAHGIHHDDPMDSTRLVMPPVPAILYFSLFYSFFSLFFTPEGHLFFMAYFMVGYLCYDYIHYATHHFKMNHKIGRYLKRHHLYHHSHHRVKFGVSSPLWDFLLGTYDEKKMEKSAVPPP